MRDSIGLMTIRSRFVLAETISRLKTELAAHGQTLFAEIDHAAGAAAVGLALRPTLLLVFGNAKVGTKLMQEDQLVGIDLPLKLLVWEDDLGRVCISANDPAWIAARHGISDPVIGGMTNFIGALMQEFTAPE